MISKFVINNLCEILNFGLRTGAKKTVERLFNDLENAPSKDNRMVLNKGIPFEQLSQYIDKPKNINTVLTNMIQSLKGEGVDLSFDKTFDGILINENASSSDENNQEITKQSAVKLNDMKYIHLTGKFNNKPFDLYITAYTQGRRFKLIYDGKTQGEVGLPSLKELFDYMTRGHITQDDFIKHYKQIIIDNKEQLLPDINDLGFTPEIKNTLSKINWKISFENPTTLDRAFKVVVVADKIDGKPLDKNNLMVLFKNIDQIREQVKEKILRSLEKKGIYPHVLKIKENTYYNFDTNPGFFVGIAPKKLPENIKESEVQPDLGAAHRIITEYKKLKG